MNEEQIKDYRILASAIEYAREAGQLITQLMERPYDIRDKVNLSDIVTEVDLQSERLLRSRVGRDYPDHWILSEETDCSGDAFERMEEPASGYGWIIDPIDGTINFVHGLPHFAVSIGILKDGQLLHGVVYNPVTCETYYATRGEGAYLDGVRLQVSEEHRIGHALLATGFQASDWRANSVNTALMNRIAGVARNVRILGAASLDLCLVASGHLTGFWHDGLYPWDVAAGMLIVQEAGGSLTNRSGGPFNLSDRTLIATNPKLQDDLVALLIAE